MGNILRYILQIFNYSVFMAVMWYFSVAPAYNHFDPEQAMIVLSFGHAGQLVEECKQRTPEELAALPPNMRTPTVCPRQRSPLDVELIIDGKLLLQKSFQPGGLSGDWGVDIYQEFKVPTGQHYLEVRLKDSVRIKDFNYMFTQDVELKSAQLLVIDFRPDEGGFILK